MATTETGNRIFESLTLPSMPQAVPTPRFRKPKENVPQTKLERDYIQHQLREYVEASKLVPPLGLKELRVHAESFVAKQGLKPIYTDYVGILLNNELWRETLATIPYERRLLLLPKCLRVEEKCPAPFDEFGLLCKQCGLCTIQDFQNEAERLGYAVLVAEGSAIVMSLIQTGKIEAIVGVSCISVLERAFPYMEAAAIPGIAVPLLQDDCINTTVDSDWVWDVIHLSSEDRTRRMNLNALRDEVGSWFSEEMLDQFMGEVEGESEKIGREWLLEGGKRWRPFLTVASYQALRDKEGDDLGSFSDDLKKVAVAVECFHKASLIHDDIADGDEERYGKKTLCERYGSAVALNVGDLLIGEGYRLLASCSADVSEKVKAEMVLIASEGQRELCRGQGADLIWNESPAILSTREVLGIFRQKTAPAFEVALRIGASFAGEHDAVADVLKGYSEGLGIAYQIRDDLDDLEADAGSEGDVRIRPSVLLAGARERSKGEEREKLEALWRGDMQLSGEAIRELVVKSQADERAMRLLESYKEQAVRALQDLDNADLKGLLRRVLGKIFNDVEIKGWCHEFETGNVTGGEAREEVSGRVVATGS